MRTIRLMNARFVAIVDDDIYPIAAEYQWWWRAQADGRRGYVISYGETPPIRLHHLVLPRRAGYLIDHVNFSTLDNRRANLRYASPSESSAHTRRKGGSSRYRGVFRERGGFAARIQSDGVRRRLGRFTDEREAARAFDRAALQAFGEFAVLNFAGPDDDDDTSDQDDE